MNDFDFILEDRIAKIKAINEQYDLEQNAYIAFSGGKDSTILHYLLDLALPNNQIPRVYINTGLEYLDMLKFVKDLALKDNRVIIVNQTKNIKKTLNEYGYPFKSKEFALRVEYFNKGSNAKFIKEYLDKNNKSGFSCPKILRFIFEKRNVYNYSNKCCYKLKKDLAIQWEKNHNRSITLTGMRSEEGGNRKNMNCVAFSNKGSLIKFHPLLVVSEKWEEQFIQIYNIQLCKLYYPPYNFTRTGCRGCPFSLTLQQDLLTMKKLLPQEYKACCQLWKPVYDEYVRLGYRLDKDFYTKMPQYTIDDYLGRVEK